MTAIFAAMRRQLNSAIVLAVVLCFWAQPARAQDAMAIKTPQSAVITFTNGVTANGTLLALDAKEALFQLSREGTAPTKYKVTSIKSIRTQADVYTYDPVKGTFESSQKPKATQEPLKGTVDPKAPIAGVQTVIVEGVGTNADGALKNAYRCAIQQVVGTLVDAETIVKDDKVISDKVLTYSDGLVKTYEELNRQEEKGLVRVKIRAVVERRSVVAKLKAANITVKEVEGKDLAAEVMTRKEARENAGALLRKEVLKLRKVMIAEVRKPSADDYDERKQVLTLAVTIRVDAGEYAAWLKHFSAVADKISLDKSSCSVLAQTRAKGEVYAEDKGRKSTYSAFAGPDLRQVPKAWCLWVLTHIDSSGLRSQWEGYVLDCDLVSTFARATSGPNVEITLTDKNNEVLGRDSFGASDSLPLRQRVRGSWLGIGRIAYRDGGGSPGSVAMLHTVALSEKSVESLDKRGTGIRNRFVQIAPLSVFFGERGEFCYQTETVVERKINVSEKDLQRLKDIKCSVVFPPAKLEGIE